MAAPDITSIEQDLSDIAEYLREWDGCEELPTVEEFFDNEPPMRATDKEYSTMDMRNGTPTTAEEPQTEEEPEYVRKLRELDKEELAEVEAVVDALLALKRQKASNGSAVE